MSYMDLTAKEWDKMSKDEKIRWAAEELIAAKSRRYPDFHGEFTLSERNAFGLLRDALNSSATKQEPVPPQVTDNKGPVMITQTLATWNCRWCDRNFKKEKYAEQHMDACKKAPTEMEGSPQCHPNVILHSPYGSYVVTCQAHPVSYFPGAFYASNKSPQVALDKFMAHLQENQ